MIHALPTERRRGIAESLGLVHPRLGCPGLSKLDVGLQVDTYHAPEEPDAEDRAPLPPGHRFFPDCDREINARKIEWLMTRKGIDSWFITFTFKRYVSQKIAFRCLGRWLHKIIEAHSAQTTPKGGFAGGRLSWCVATEWQKRDVIHFHLILSGAGLGSLSRKRWENRWEAGHAEGFARIHDAVKEAAPYLAKYTSKGLGGTLRWHLPLRGTTVPRAVTCCQA